MPKRNETNVEFVQSLMEVSNYGALAQLFIIDAIDKWSKKVAEVGLDEVRRQMADSPISPDAWYGVAVEIQRKLKERSG